MQINTAFRFLLIGFVSVAIAMESNRADCDAQQRLVIGEIKMALIGRDPRSVMEHCGKPILKFGDYPDQTWNYSTKLHQGDVTRITGFTVLFLDGKVFDVSETTLERRFESQTGMIGKFAGYIGKDATQRDIILSFESSMPPAKLSREDKVRILQELQHRIALAKQRREKMLLPRSCDFVKLAGDILERYGSPFAPVTSESELVVDMQREEDKIVSVLNMLAKPKLQDK